MRIILATLLATAIATPAAAQNSKNRTNDQTVQQSMASESQTIKSKKARRGTGAYAQAPWAPNASAQSTHHVYVNGTYVGSDPDPRVRETLRREARGETSGGGDGGGAD